MSLPFVLAMARRESRAAFRRFALLMTAVALGVGALVAIESFGANLQESVRAQARTLLGADLVLRSTAPFSSTAETIVSDLQGSGVESARVTRFAAMAYVNRTNATRLVQVTAVSGGYPFYGEIETEPGGLWSRLPTGDGALVEPSLLLALEAQVGDTLALGNGRFVIRGTVTRMPGDVGVRSALGPRVFIPAALVAETGLLVPGSRVQYEVYLRSPGGVDAERLAGRHRAALARERVSLRTVAENQEGLNRTLRRLERYLGLVALMAVLLAGLGVASAVHVFIQRRIDTIGILRCLGTDTRSLIGIYLAQALFVALVGTVAGAGLGIGLQALLPRLLRGLVPVTVGVRPSWRAVGWGLLTGQWVATLFALLPLLSIRRVSPLVVFRRSYEDAPTAPRDWARLLVSVAVAGSVVALAAVQAHSIAAGLAFAVGIGLALGLLGLAALALTRLLKRWISPGWPYVCRQGLANLFRPANQTVMVVVALGFGAFLLDTLFVVQHSLVRGLQPAAGMERPNLALFDIQPDQRAVVQNELRQAGLPFRPPIPIVPMRILSVKGRPASSVLATPDRGPERRGAPNHWTLRREYRSTCRDGLTATESTAGGRLWEPGAGHRLAAGVPVPISVETGVAGELGVAVGDEIVWDVQGLPVASRVAHLREVTWAQFEPNFYVVFPEGPLDSAPQTFATLVRAEDAASRVRLVRRLVEAVPNVSVLDLTQVQEALESVLGRIASVVRAIALLSLATGALVLAGAVATSRYQRLREAVLLRTLGATRGQVLRIAAVEYAVLGALSAASGLVLAMAASWGLVHYLFEIRYGVPPAPLFALAAGLLALTVAVGLLGSLEAVRRSPLKALLAESL